MLILGTRNLECTYGLQVVASEYDIDESAQEDWEGLTGVLGTPRQMRLTSFPSRHFLGTYKITIPIRFLLIEGTYYIF